MTLTETHHINKESSLYNIFDDLCFKAKNLYNAALYTFRQSFFDDNTKTLGWMESAQCSQNQNRQTMYLFKARLQTML